MKVLLFFIVLFFVSCNKKQKTIDDEVLKSIIYDAVFTDIMLSTHSRDVPRDSIQFFASILEKHNCTIEEFEYTIERMALRKSNILPMVITELSKEIEAMKDIYKYNAKSLNTWDRRADSIYSKELFIDSMDIKHIDSIKNAIFVYDIKNKGELEVKFSYMIDTLDKNRNYTLTATYKDTITNKTRKARSSWLSRYNKMEYKRDSIRIDIDDKYHQIIINFLDITPSGKNKIKKPYIYFDTMQVIFHYPKLESRVMLLDSIMYIDDFRNNLNKIKNVRDIKIPFLNTIVDIRKQESIDTMKIIAE